MKQLLPSRLCQLQLDTLLYLNVSKTGLLQNIFIEHAMHEVDAIDVLVYRCCAKVAQPTTGANVTCRNL